MKICPKCSRSVIENSKFCTYCGGSLTLSIRTERNNETKPEQQAEKMPIKEKKQLSKKVFYFALPLIIGIIGVFFYENNTKESTNIENSEDSSVELFFKKFVTQLNTSPLETNSYVDKKNGVVSFSYSASEGFIANSESKLIVDEITNNPLMINGEYSTFYDVIESSPFPEYLGAFEYQNYGFFIKKFELSKDKINPNNYGNEDNVKLISQTNKLCNYVCKAMTTKGDYLYTFYFLIEKKKKQLLAYNIEPVADLQFVSLKKDKKITFNDDKNVLNYLKNKYFSSSENEGNYFIDFKTNRHNLNWEQEIQMFSNLKIGKIENVSKNIQYRVISFDSENQIVNGLFYITNYGEIRIISRSLDEPIVLNSK